ncbi:TPA: hypothetical protein ACIR1N_006036 [Pseudomonas aeruginosa]
MNKANECTCPSGDGSLVHPCPAHPAVEQAGGDERDLQGAQGERDGWGPLPIVQVPWNVFDRAVMWVEDRRRYGDDGTIVDDWKALKTIQRAALAQPSPVLPPFAEKVLAKLRRFYDCASDFESGGVDIGRHWLDLLTQLGLLNRVQRSPALWEITQQGEDLLGTPQPSPAQADEKPGDSILCYGCFAKGVGPEHFDEAGKCLVRQQLDPLNLAQHAEEFNEAPAEALKPEQAEAERPKIVATLFTPNEKVHDDIGFKAFAVAGDCDKDGGEFYDPEKLMTVAQHGRIVGELRTEIAMLRSYESEWELLLNQHEQERDAALARVAELESKLAELEKQEPVGCRMSRSALTEAQMRRIYENSTEIENERLGFAAFARLMRRAEAVHQIAAAPGKEG